MMMTTPDVDLRQAIITSKLILESLLETAIDRLTGHAVRPPPPVFGNLPSLVGKPSKANASERQAILAALKLQPSRDISGAPDLGLSAAGAAVDQHLFVRAACLERGPLWTAAIAALQLDSGGARANNRVNAWLRANFLTPETRLVVDLLDPLTLIPLLCTELKVSPWSARRGQKELLEELSGRAPSDPPGFISQIVLCLHAKLAIGAGAEASHLARIPLARHPAIRVVAKGTEPIPIPDSFAPYFQTNEETG